VIGAELEDRGERLVDGVVVDFIEGDEGGVVKDMREGTDAMLFGYTKIKNSEILKDIQNAVRFWKKADRKVVKPHFSGYADWIHHRVSFGVW